MSRELIIQMRKDLSRKKEILELYRRLQSELVRAKENGDTIKASSLQKTINVDFADFVDSEDTILQEIINSNIRNVTTTNGIYVCLGAYDENDYLVTDFSSQVKYKVYVDVEKSLSCNIKFPKEESLIFENLHTVLFAPEGMNPIVFFKRLQLEYYRNALEKDDNFAKSEVLETKKRIW